MEAQRSGRRLGARLAAVLVIAAGAAALSVGSAGTASAQMGEYELPCDLLPLQPSCLRPPDLPPGFGLGNEASCDDDGALGTAVGSTRASGLYEIDCNKNTNISVAIDITPNGPWATLAADAKDCAGCDQLQAFATSQNPLKLVTCYDFKGAGKSPRDGKFETHEESRHRCY
jgi:hypothetical protein